MDTCCVCRTRDSVVGRRGRCEVCPSHCGQCGSDSLEIVGTSEWCARCGALWQGAWDRPALHFMVAGVRDGLASAGSGRIANVIDGLPGIAGIERVGVTT